MPLNVLSEIHNCNIFTQGLINFLVYLLVIRYQSKRSSFLLIHYEINFTCFCKKLLLFLRLCGLCGICGTCGITVFHSFPKSDRSDISANVVDICLCVNIVLS